MRSIPAFLAAAKEAFGFLIAAGYVLEQEEAGTSFDNAMLVYGSPRLRFWVERDRGHVGLVLRPMKGLGSCDDEILRLLLSGAAAYDRGDGPATLASLAELVRGHLTAIEDAFGPAALETTMRRVQSLQEQRATALFGPLPGRSVPF